MTSATNLSMKITTEYPMVTLSPQSKELYTMVTLTAPHYDSEETGGRAPIDIVCVIDKSGSMSGEKIELMKKTLLFMVEQLKEMDKLSLVLFDSDISTVLTSRLMDADGKEEAKRLISQIYPGSCTNLCGGVLQGLDIVGATKDRSTADTVTSLLVFTDGLANEGISKSSEIVVAVRNKLEQIGRSVSVFSFGFGADHDANMLRAVSEAGNGLYYYLETAEAIPETFSDCLGGLLSVLAQNIKVTIKTRQNGVEIGSILSSYRKTEVDPLNHIEIIVGDLYSEESKNLVFTVKLNDVSAPVEVQELVQVTLNYFNVIETESVSVEQIAKIARVDTMPPNVSVNPTLDEQRNRVECARALELGRNLANQNKLEEARKLLQSTVANIQQSDTSKESFCQGLVQDLEDCLGDMQSKSEYESIGSKKMNNYWMSSNYERSTNTKSAAQACYVTSSKMKKKSEASSFLNK